jgi:hypothetical protein
MKHRKLIAVLACCGLIAAGIGATVASGATAPKRADVIAVTKFKVKVNRYVQAFTRFKRDTYFVRSGGTLRLINNAPDEGPHTLTVVKKKDLPKTVKEIFECSICKTLGEAHGADPETEGPPKFLFLENGTGSETAPNVDQPGDSAFVDAKKGAKVDLTVTAKKGKELYFMCIIHPWMQSKVLVR